MKIFHLVLSIWFLACTTAYAAEAKQSALPNADEASYLLGLIMGANVKGSIENIDFQGFMKGFKESYSQPLDQQKLTNASQKMQAYQQAYLQKLGQKALANGEQFLKKNAKRKGVKTTETGLQYEVLKKGYGNSPQVTDQVTVHYQGTLVDGTVFDSSYKRGEPTTFALNQVIPGWSEGLQLMSKGAKYKLYIPTKLAYAERGAGGAIGPNEALIFEVELLDINSTKAAE